MDMWTRGGLKPRLEDRKMGGGKIGGASEGIFSRVPFSCHAGYAPIKSI